eukprot:jgi/Hompol1/6791/HPOL_002332-RA
MGNMRTHSLLHLGVKPFVCTHDRCSKSFTQLGNLKSHQSKVHGIQSSPNPLVPTLDASEMRMLKAAPSLSTPSLVNVDA